MTDTPVLRDTGVVYRFKNGLYINLTNRCPNLCVFCIKTKWKMMFDGHTLALSGGEPSARKVLDLLYSELKEAPASEIVFCGYGESTYRLPQMLEIARELKQKIAAGDILPMKIRLNTVGLGSAIWKRNIVPELSGLIDVVYISLNSHDPAQWRALIRPHEGFEQGYGDVVQFIKDSVGKFEKVVVSAVDKQGVDSALMKSFVESLGAEFYLRSYLDEE